MHRHDLRAALLGVALSTFFAVPLAAQHAHMPTLPLGGGWELSAMAQAFPVVTVGAPRGASGDPLRRTGWYLTQPAVMAHAASAGHRVVLHTTLNFEGLTQRNGELTFGGWGEGFIDKRHPHTLLHEMMLSVNAWNVAGGAMSLSAGKGFAPYGTSDPMARPGLKYPTNHHLSQILERWTLDAAWMRAGWIVEAGLFGGQEPDGAYDFSNIESFGDSWSARIMRRWGATVTTGAQWEASLSFASVTEFAHTVQETTHLTNAALQRTGDLGAGRLYVLGEASRSFLTDHTDFYSLLAEARWDDGRRQPYARVELAARPEYEREGAAGDESFFRYDHEVDPVGRTHWLIVTAAYAQQVTRNPWSVRPFVEVQHHSVWADLGPSAGQLFGSTSFWALTLGARLIVGGDPMRMGAYGVLDSMTEMGRDTGMAGMSAPAPAAHVH
ncbi:MAG: hypothetical protein AB7T31_02120 [Gemmatimonadales bacterium]